MVTFRTGDLITYLLRLRQLLFFVALYLFSCSRRFLRLSVHLVANHVRACDMLQRPLLANQIPLIRAHIVFIDRILCCISFRVNIWIALISNLLSWFAKSALVLFYVILGLLVLLLFLNLLVFTFFLGFFLLSCLILNLLVETCGIR